MIKPNEDAIAYGYIMILVYLLAAVFIWGCWSYIYDIILTVVINPDIMAGGISLQTRNAVNWPIDVWRYSVPLILICAFIWATNRAIYKRGGA